MRDTLRWEAPAMCGGRGSRPSPRTHGRSLHAGRVGSRVGAPRPYTGRRSWPEEPRPGPGARYPTAPDQPERIPAEAGGGPSRSLASGQLLLCERAGSCGRGEGFPASPAARCSLTSCALPTGGPVPGSPGSRCPHGPPRPSRHGPAACSTRGFVHAQSLGLPLNKRSLSNVCSA